MKMLIQAGRNQIIRGPNQKDGIKIRSPQATSLRAKEIEINKVSVE